MYIKNIPVYIYKFINHMPYGCIMASRENGLADLADFFFVVFVVSVIFRTRFKRTKINNSWY